MDTLLAIFTRRSVRNYEPGQLTKEQINNLLKAAMAAPSAGNSQPWHFVVVDDHNKLKQISSFHPYAKMASQAALAILVCAEPALEKFPGYWPQDCAAAVQNILLAAHAQGLGAVWVGIHPGNDSAPFKELFELPQGIEPMALVVIGSSSSAPEDPKRYLPERVHLNKFARKAAP